MPSPFPVKVSLVKRVITSSFQQLLLSQNGLFSILVKTCSHHSALSVGQGGGPDGLSSQGRHVRIAWKHKCDTQGWTRRQRYILTVQCLPCAACISLVLVQFHSVAQSCPTLCDPRDCSTPGLPTITNSRSSLRLMSIKSVMLSSHLILCRPHTFCP